MKTSLPLLAATAGVLMGAQPVYADYSFSDACAPEATYDLSVRAPNVLLILDRSNSMNVGSGEDVDGGGEDSRFKVAQLTIEDLAVANHHDGGCLVPSDPGCDDVFLGLGYYAGNSNTSSPDSLDAFIAASPADNTRDAILTSITSIDAPGGSGTTTGDAAARIAADMQDDTRDNYAVIITDGKTTGSGQQRNAITELCAARDRETAPVTTYIIGFGSDSNAEDNSFLAAAGGTGSCCASTSPPCDEAEQRDPCDFDPNTLYNADNTRTGTTSSWDCEGSLESDGSGLKDALEATLAGAECTFALEIPDGYPEGRAKADPAATRVRIEMPSMVGGVLDLPHVSDPSSPSTDFAEYLTDVWGVDSEVADDYDDEGWYFSNDERVAVTLSDGLCEEVRSGNLTQVLTQVACICELTGQDCTITAGFEGFTNEQIENMRCTAGKYECIDGEDVCVGSDDPLPEICNGIDDNCDGATDNLGSGQADWEAWEAMDPANDTQSLHCNYLSVCVCGGGPDQRAPGGASFQEHIDSWTGTCTCGEGLEADTSVNPQPERIPASQSPQTCSSAGRGFGGAAALLLVGMLGVRLRRRKASHQ